jgi:hypothetical protein
MIKEWSLNPYSNNYMSGYQGADMSEKKNKKKPITPRRVVLTPKLEQHLKEQIEFLTRSIRDYDLGCLSEYKRMATIIRVVAYDGGRSTSLISHLGMEQEPFVSYAAPLNPRNLLTEQSLIILKVSQDSCEHLPVLDQGPPMMQRWLPKNEWLNEPVFRDSNRNEFSRLDFIKWVANQDGGAHVDGSVEENYARLQEGETVGWIFEGPNGPVPITDIARSHIRHFAFEFLTSLNTAWQRYIGNRECECGSSRKARYCCLKGQ